MYNKLQHLYGRVKLSNAPRERELWEDTLGFALSCTPAEFFDFLELTFHSAPMWRVLNDDGMIS